MFNIEMSQNRTLLDGASRTTEMSLPASLCFSLSPLLRNYITVSMAVQITK